MKMKAYGNNVKGRKKRERKGIINGVKCLKNASVKKRFVHWGKNCIAKVGEGGGRKLNTRVV